MDYEFGSSQSENGVILRCKRCAQSFNCEHPELSAAVECPHCSKVAVMSVEDAERVQRAAEVQLRDSTFNRRFEDQRSLHKRAIALLPETRTEYAHRADRLRRGAINTCPHCLYNLAGVLGNESTMPCPECGEEASRSVNTLIWGERANACVFNRNIARFGGLVVGVLYWIVLIGASVMERMSGFFEFLLFLIIAGIFGLPIGVSFAAYRWLRLRDPTMSRVNVVLVAILAGIANTSAAILLALIANAVLPYF